ncbi:MAG: L,D-transpeptidase family protein [Acidobacteria bacterium]|nr:L,D-transpeptidase family protein [Acidobacteriota bacterium]
MSRRFASCTLVLTLISTPVSSLDEASHAGALTGQPSSFLEQRLIWALMDIRAGRLNDALGHANWLVEAQPDFELAQLVKADVLSALSEPLGVFGARRGAEEKKRGLREEAQARLQRFLEAPPAGAVPAHLVRLPADIDHAVLVDTENYRLYVFEVEEGTVRRLFDFYVSIGRAGTDKRHEGDEKTPTGLYRIASYLPGERLPGMYGRGAFPLDYPNEWDRLHDRTGSGIWIHGTESERYSRPPLSSLGCVTLSNEDFLRLSEIVEVGKTPVVLSRGVRWLSAESVGAVRETIEEAVEGWRRDWESRDTDRLLSHYSDSFRTAGMSRDSFAARKRRVTGEKSFIEIAVKDLAIYGYPGEGALVTVEFLQEYRSNSFNDARRKRQYWRREAGNWRIVYES